MHIPTIIFTIDNDESATMQSYGDIPNIKDVLTYDEDHIYCFKQYSSEGVITIYNYSISSPGSRSKGYCIFNREIQINSTPGDVVKITSTQLGIYCSISRKKIKSLYIFNKAWKAILIATNLDPYATVLSAYESDWILVEGKYILNLITNMQYECSTNVRAMISFHDTIYYRDELHAYQFHSDGTSELIFRSTTGRIWQMISANATVAFIMIDPSTLSLSVVDMNHKVHVIAVTGVISTICYQSLIYYNVGKSLYVYDHNMKNNTLISDDCISYQFAGTSGQLGYMTSEDMISHPKGVAYYEVPSINFPVRTYSNIYSDIDIVVM